MSDHTNPRRILLDLAVTLDGFIEGKNGEIDWCIMEPDMDFISFLNQIDTILFGRKSYEIWEQYRPHAEAPEMEKEIWQQIQRKKKVVFSRTRTKTGPQATFIHGPLYKEVMKIKNQPGKDIWLYGGADLIASFIDLGLVDEFRLSVHPVVLGEGKPLFTDLKKRLNLKLMQTRTFSSGVVQLIYHPKDK
ncbi:dihydrofolate reductase family protein [Thermoactinomyces sp. CICC 10735]|uniref:dihydrofolate reductase family protein n=1 Tax=Thermoactinomyces sp. CICC 10735 TaxID=2767430 RepID=UPI0018DC236A|nr:dihydrofolate reductase family protein [Thermoactinomyces sp. CICC 10735]MBH8582044.1 dihydrofolate reductase [Thermoactinomyces sp. CICC 10735]